MPVLRPLIDDTEVTLAFYGSIVYLAIVSAFGSQREPPGPTVAISAIVATASYGSSLADAAADLAPGEAGVLGAALVARFTDGPGGPEVGAAEDPAR